MGGGDFTKGLRQLHQNILQIFEFQTRLSEENEVTK